MLRLQSKRALYSFTRRFITLEQKSNWTNLLSEEKYADGVSDTSSYLEHEYDPDAVLYQNEFLCRLQQYQKAHDNISTLLKSHNDHQLYYCKAIINYHENKFEEATDSIDTAIKLCPDNHVYRELKLSFLHASGTVTPITYLQVAMTYAEQGNYDSALKVIEKCIQKFPSAAFFYEQNSKLLAITEQFDLAITNIDIAIELYGKNVNPQLYFEKARLIFLKIQNENSQGGEVSVRDILDALQSLETYLITEEGAKNMNAQHNKLVLIVHLRVASEEYDTAMEVVREALRQDLSTKFEEPLSYAFPDYTLLSPYFAVWARKQFEKRSQKMNITSGDKLLVMRWLPLSFKGTEKEQQVLSKSSSDAIEQCDKLARLFNLSNEWNQELENLGVERH